MQFDVKITLTERRCHDCGRWYASELSVCHCPMCGQNRIDSLLESLNQAVRKLNAQKSATSRAANGRKAKR